MPPSIILYRALLKISNLQPFTFTYKIPFCKKEYQVVSVEDTVEYAKKEVIKFVLELRLDMNSSTSIESFDNVEIRRLEAITHMKDSLVAISEAPVHVFPTLIHGTSFYVYPEDTIDIAKKAIEYIDTEYSDQILYKFYKKISGLKERKF